MSFLVESDDSIVRLKLEGEQRIEDAATMHGTLRASCGADSELIVDAIHCGSIEFCVLQLLYCTMRSVKKFSIRAYSNDFIFCIDRAGLRSLFRESCGSLKSAEGCEGNGNR